MTPEQPRNVIDEALSQIAPDAATGATGATRAALFRYSCLHSHSSGVHVLAALEPRLDHQQVEETWGSGATLSRLPCRLFLTLSQ